MSELIKDNFALDEDTRKCAEHIHKSGRQLLEFVRKTSLLCDLKSGKKPALVEALAADRYENAVSVVSKQLSENSRPVFDSNIPDDLVIVADWELMELVLIYLLTNAVEYSPSMSAIETTFSQSGGVFQIRVRNEGEGIDPAWIDKIFDEFAIKDVKHHHRGQGISLAIAKHVVELHGGTIEVSSAPREGAEFTINLPVI